MSVLGSTDVLRPRSWLARGVAGTALRLLPVVFAFLRRFWPIPHLGKTYAVTRYDDVVEVFGTDSVFGVPYNAKLDLLMDHQPFILGMASGPEYQAAIAALRSVFRAEDLPGLATRVEMQAAAIVERANGRLEIVDQLVRQYRSTSSATILVSPRLTKAIFACGARGCSNISSSAAMRR